MASTNGDTVSQYRNRLIVRMSKHLPNRAIAEIVDLTPQRISQILGEEQRRATQAVAKRAAKKTAKKTASRA